MAELRRASGSSMYQDKARVRKPSQGRYLGLMMLFCCGFIAVYSG